MTAVVIMNNNWSVAMKNMKVMTKLIGIAILTTAISAPAFAQMYEAPYGRTVATAPARVHARTIPRHYQQSYAMSPRRPVGIYGGYSNYDTGGGSPGYNEMLLTW
jgi:hypothetical protein